MAALCSRAFRRSVAMLVLRKSAQPAYESCSVTAAAPATGARVSWPTGVGSDVMDVSDGCALKLMRPDSGFCDVMNGACT